MSRHLNKCNEDVSDAAKRPARMKLSLNKTLARHDAKGHSWTVCSKNPFFDPTIIPTVLPFPTSHVFVSVLRVSGVLTEGVKLSCVRMKPDSVQQEWLVTLWLLHWCTYIYHLVVKKPNS